MTSSSTLLSTEVKNLYKEFLKLSRKWPSQPLRTINMNPFIKSEIAKQFRLNLKNEPPTSQETSSYSSKELKERLNYGKSQLKALNDILEGKIEDKYESHLKAYLPSIQTYQILDKQIQADWNSGKLKPSLFPEFFATKNAQQKK